MAKKTSPQEQHRWRENIEALAVAVIVALLFKYFILEISKIPSGSMQPTLMGHPESGVNDRVLVDKLSFRFRDPQRYEIVVFKHPLERSRVMVKRLIGMPGEELKIEGGDLWTRRSPEGEWSILRPPASVQGELWRVLGVDKPQRAVWGKASGDGWLTTGREARTTVPGTIVYPPGGGTIRDGYADGYPEPLRQPVLDSVGGSRANNNVADLRVTGKVEAAADTSFFSVTLTEGARAYEFRVPGPAGASDAKAEVRIRAGRADSDQQERIERANGGHLSKRKTSFAVENLNDRLKLELDGKELLSVEISSSEDRSARIEIGFETGGGKLEDLRVYRDIHYITPDGRGGGWTVTIPEGHYVMLGDNTQDSADSRLWEQQTIRLEDPRLPAEVRGNYRKGSGGERGILEAQNPIRGTGDHVEEVRFRDVWGEMHWFTSHAPGAGDFTELGPVEPYSLVPRNLIQGRAMAVFWPFKPQHLLWRLAWLH